MNIRFNIVILVINMCSSENSVYDWHIRTIDRSDTDFGDDLKTQTALNNERQQDLLKFSGQTNNMESHPYSYYNLFPKNMDSKNTNNEKLQNQLNEPIHKKYEDRSDFQSIFDDINIYNPNENSKQNNNRSSFGKDGVDEHIEEPHKIYTKNQNYILGNNLKHSKDQIEENPSHSNIQHEKNSRTFNKNDYNEKLLPVDIESFVGTNLFESRDKKCFSNEDAALLAVRRDFEMLVPKYLPQSLFDDHMVTLLMNYFYICHQMVTGTSSLRTRPLVQKAFYDTLGGYLNFYMVPVAKYSFYAGQISLNTVKQILLLHEESKKFLNTNGNGWKAPLQNVLTQLKTVHIEPLHIPEIDYEAHGEPSFCMQLNMNTDENQPDNDKIIVQLPKIEAENAKGHLGNIWLPFRRKRTFDLKLESSVFIVAKFYETVTKCYRFENIDQQFFNEEFKTWLMENINIHLSDEEFYPGLGAVLRIAEFLKGSKQQVIGIGKDSRMMFNMDQKLNKYRSYKTGHEPELKSSKTDHHETNENQHDFKETIGDELKKSDGENLEFSTSVRPVPPKSIQDLLRTLDFSTPQIAIITIPVIALILIVTLCCWKCFCKKKKTAIVLKPVKNSSSSSSNLFNSPVRFFRIRKRSASNTSAVNYSSNENSNKKNKKSVKIDKKPLISSDTSASSSPSRKQKSKAPQGSKDKEKGKDSDKSNSKSSWQTTYSSK